LAIEQVGQEDMTAPKQRAGVLVKPGRNGYHAMTAQIGACVRVRKLATIANAAPPYAALARRSPQIKRENPNGLMRIDTSPQQPSLSTMPELMLPHIVVYGYTIYTRRCCARRVAGISP
jgi:hypothetical protein